jgi:hypothetical protein
VCRDDDGRPAPWGQAGQQVDDLAARGRVEVSCRLVGEDDVGLDGKQRGLREG